MVRFHTVVCSLTCAVACGSPPSGPKAAPSDPPLLPTITAPTAVANPPRPEAQSAPALACDTGATRTVAPAPEPTWFCARPDGTRHGPFVTLFPDRSTQVRGTFVDGVLDGAWERRHPTGGIAETGAYLAGTRTGRWRQLGPAGEELGAYDLVKGTGVEKRWLDDGTRYSEIAYKAGVRHGTSKLFTPQGAVIAAARYKDGKLDGPVTVGTPRTIRIEESYRAGVRTGQRQIWQHGYLFAEENYDRRGKLDGPYLLWRGRNVLRVQGRHAQGARVGAWQWHDRNQRKERAGSYVAGKKDGAWTEWWDDKIVFTGHYRAGKPDGEFTYFDRNGKELGRFAITAGTGTMLTFHPNRKPATRQRLRNGLAEGRYQELTPRGTVTVDGSHRAGKQHGTWKEWTADGVLLREQTWKLGKLHGTVKKYVDGKLSLEATYQDGMAHGRYVEHRRGAPAVTGSFVADRKHGTWTHHAPDGAVVLTATYEEGVLDGPWRQLTGGVVIEGTMRAGRRAGRWTLTDKAGAVRELAYETP